MFNCYFLWFMFSMFNSLLYFATLSVLQGAPVFIWPAFTATAKSAIVVSSVSPDLCEIIVLYPFSFALFIVSNVSVNVPIWFGFISIAFAIFSFIPLSNLFIFVTNRSSPTSWILSPKSLVIFFQLSQSSSANHWYYWIFIA